MRREPFTVGSYVHIVKRGTRGLPIVRDESDRHRFLLMLRHFNDEFCPDNWFRDLFEVETGLIHSMERPANWPPQRKIVQIVCFCLVENHLHLLLKEIIPGGIAKFMRRLGVGMVNHFNEKYQEKGSLFQGAYRSRTIDANDYLQYVSAYIQVKNCFELYSGGYELACKNFTKAFDWAEKYSYCSLGEFMQKQEKIITEPDLLSEIFTPSEYKVFCDDFISGRMKEENNFVHFE